MTKHRQGRERIVHGYSHNDIRGPDGSTSRGWFRSLSIEPYRRFEVEDGFFDDAGAPSTQMPTMRMTFNFDATDSGSRFTSVTHFASSNRWSNS